MAKKNKNTSGSLKDLFQDFNTFKAVDYKSIDEQVQDSMLSYGDHIIRKRSIPSCLDGLKPVQRRALYTFHYLNKINIMQKLANISGTCMGNFHPHGDSSINDTVVNLVQQWKNAFPLLIGQGAWGTMSGDDPAAARYIEVKMPSDIAEILFTDLNKDNVVPWEKTYDESKEEPSLLPTKYPLHLINGTSGIAYSMGTSIPSYNIKELTEAFIYLINNKFYDKDFKIEEHIDNLKQIIKGVDLPTGCSVWIKDGDYLMDHSFGIGMRANFELDKKNNTITITNIPMEVTTEKLKEEFIALALDYKKVGTGKKEVKIAKDPSEILLLKSSSGTTPIQISYDVDEKGKSILNAARIVLVFKPSADLDIEMLKLIKKTSLETSFRANIKVISSHDAPVNMSLYQNIRTFLMFRLHCVYQGILYDLKKLNAQVHILEGLQIVLEDRDKLINLISKSVDLVPELKLAYPQLSDIQVEAIADAKISKLSRNEITKLVEDINSKIDFYNSKVDTIDSDYQLFEYIKEDYENLLNSRLIQKQERQSEIITGGSNISLADLIEDEEVIVLSMSDETIGYIQGSKHKSYNRGAKLKGAKNDFDIDGTVEVAYHGMLKDDALFITNKGRVFKENILKFDKRFLNIRNYLNLDKDEKVISITKYNPEDELNTHLLIITDNMVKNISLDSFGAATANRGVIGLKLPENNYVNSVMVHNPNELQDMIVLSKDGKILRFDKNEIAEMKGRTSAGKRVISKKTSVLKAFLVKKQEEVTEKVYETIIDPKTNEKIKKPVYETIINPESNEETIFEKEVEVYVDDGQKLLLVSDLGKGKIVSLHEIRGKGIGQAPITVFNNDTKNGNLINGFIINNESVTELVLLSKNSEVTVVKISELNEVSRTAKGALKLINNENHSKIVNSFLRDSVDTGEVVEVQS